MCEIAVIVQRYQRVATAESNVWAYSFLEDVLVNLGKLANRVQTQREWDRDAKSESEIGTGPLFPDPVRQSSWQVRHD